MAKVLTYRPEVNEFKLQSLFYFWTNTFGKSMNTVILTAIG